MTPRRLKFLVIVGMMLISGRVLAEDLPSGYYQVTNLVTLNTDGFTFNLPTGTRVITPDVWNLLDDEVKRLQDQETRLKAENQSLKNALNAWSPGVGTLLVIAGSVVAVGVAVHYWP